MALDLLATPLPGTNLLDFTKLLSASEQQRHIDFSALSAFSQAFLSYLLSEFPS